MENLSLVDFLFVQMDHIFKFLVISISFKYVLVVQKTVKSPRTPRIGMDI